MQIDVLMPDFLAAGARVGKRGGKDEQGNRIFPLPGSVARRGQRLPRGGCEAPACGAGRALPGLSAGHWDDGCRANFRMRFPGRDLTGREIQLLPSSSWSIVTEGWAQPASPTMRAGTPATVLQGGTSLSTTEPAAMRVQ